MRDFNRLLTASLFSALALGAAGCETEETADGAGGEAGAAGEAGMGGDAGGGGEEPPADYQYLIIVDNSGEENAAGTPGVDICGMVFNCGADDFPPDLGTGELISGAGLICDGSNMDAPCESGTNRADPAAATDLGDMCDPGSSPSDYVSLGVDGQLSVSAGVDLQGCTVTIVELDGGSTPNEGYSVYVCQTPDLDDETCLGGAAVAESPETGGTIEVEIAAAE